MSIPKSMKRKTKVSSYLKNSTILNRRVKELRESLDMPAIQFAKRIGTSCSNVGNWELGAQLRSDFLKRICEEFEVSADYMLGLTDEKIPRV